MSTGVVSILLHELPYNGHWLRIISTIFFVLNVVLYVLFLAISCLRYAMWPEMFPAMIRHPQQSLFLGAFPVGLATIIDMVVLVCVPAWGQGMVTLAWVLWWIDGVIALVVCFHMSFVM
jgi:tellurite resistance protein TehA-like permease